MIVQLILTLPAMASASAPAVVFPSTPTSEARMRLDEEFDKRLADAGTDVDKLWQLHLWCKETSRSAESRTVLKKVIEVSPDHPEARKALGHHFYDNKWFETYTALAKYKRDEEGKMKEKGLARYKDEWISIADVPYKRMGWVKDSEGAWRSPHEIEARAQEAKYTADGWQLRAEDSVWVSPDEFEKWKAGLWKCEDKWVTTEEANQYHSQFFRWWRMKGQHFIVNSTCDRNPADPGNCLVKLAADWADYTFQDLMRLYGIQPTSTPEIIVLRSTDQYKAFGAGDPANGVMQNDSSGFSSCHYAYFADTLVDITVQPLEYKGQGVGYWDVADPNMRPFGEFSVRHAAGLSYAEAIDPSLDTISRFIETPTAPPAMTSFWAEKKIPRWLRYGGATYVERYAADPRAPEDKWRTRNWAVENLKKAGELMPLDQVFTLPLDPNDQAASERVIKTAGLLVAFMLDGKCAPVIEKHQALKAALKAAGDTAKAVEELQGALVANVDALKQFAGF